MQFVTDYPALVIPGSWNNAIFSQEWVSRHLLPNEELTVELPLHGNGSARISTNELRISTLDNRLLLNILQPEDTVFEKLTNLAKKITEYLPHTPINSFGYNFNFVTPDASTQPLLDIFSALNSRMELLKGDAQNATITKSVRVDSHIQSIIVEFPEQKYFTIKMNYHFNVSSLTEVSTLLTQKSILEYKKNTLDILSSLFNLELSTNVKS